MGRNDDGLDDFWDEHYSEPKRSHAIWLVVMLALTVILILVGLIWVPMFTLGILASVTLAGIMGAILLLLTGKL